VPFDAGHAGIQGQRRLLGLRFLHVVLAEGALARGGQRGHRFGRLQLAHGQQARAWPTGLPGRVIKSLNDRI